jgi:hypothetical protein
VVRELGLERCETVWSLSTTKLEVNLPCVVVREDSIQPSSGAQL